MKPSTTLTLLSQPPLLGSFFSAEGKRASRANGRAKAMEKASMVTMGVQNSPWVLLMSTVPTMGPVQLKLTSTSVRARKNTPRRPPLLLFASALVVQLDGRVISKAPKKEAANTMKMTKNRMFGSQWVASQLKISAVIPAPPSSQVRPMMMQMGTVYSSTMNSPYMAALKRPPVSCLMKNETVIGTMGNTQGVRSIRKPHRMASRISPHRLPPFSFPAVPGTFTGTEKVHSSGIWQKSPLQALQVTLPSTVAEPLICRSCRST